jgi:hypothetical protein
MAVITRYSASPDSLPGAWNQLPDQYITDVALTEGDIVYQKANGNLAKALATDGTAVTDRAIGAVPKGYSAGDAVTVHNGNISYAYAAEAGYTPGTRVFLSGATAGLITDTAHFSGQSPLGYIEPNGGSIWFFQFRF